MCGGGFMVLKHQSDDLPYIAVFLCLLLASIQNQKHGYSRQFFGLSYLFHKICLGTYKAP